MGSSEFTLDLLGTYATGLFDEGAAEIVAYDPQTQRLFFTNAEANNVGILSIADPATPTQVNTIDMSIYGDGINSLDISNGILAVAVQDAATDGNGSVILFNTATSAFIAEYTVGVLPDMITFTPDGTKILTANEGEPSDDYLTDPEGSVSIIDISGGADVGSVTTVGFTDYNDRRAELLNQGVRIFGPNATVAQDLEPEYITVADSLAYVSLQENNAVAIINVNTATVVDIKALGFKDHSTGQPELTQYFLNQLTNLPELGTPTYGGGQPPVFLGGFSGLYYDAGESTDSELVFYAVPDRGPNDGAVNRNNVVSGTALTNLRPFKLPDYQGRIAKFTVNVSTGTVTLDDQILLTRTDGTTPITGRGNIPGFDETPVVPADSTIVVDSILLSEDFEDAMLAPFTAVSLASNEDWAAGDFNGDNFAEINGFDADVASDDWLVSPAIDLTTATAASFSFESTAGFTGPDVAVLISTNFDVTGMTVGDAAWTDITDRATLSAGDNTDTPSGSIDLSDFIGETVRIAWQYTSSGTQSGEARRWQIDDVEVLASVLVNDFIDIEGNVYDALEFDEFGGDFESVIRDPNGNFWMCDEYRPAIYQFDPSGTLVNRFVPQGTSQLGTTVQPAGTYGMETLPAVYAKRRANRGFEGMALNTDDGLLYAFIQTPLYNPDNSTRNASDVIRILAVDPADGSPVAEYVYLLEANANRAFDIGRVDKIGDVAYAGNGLFYVLERDSSVPGQDEGKKYIFSMTLTGATDIRSLAIADEDGTNGMTLEEMSADDLAAAGINPVNKVKVLNLPSIGYLPSDKPEGLTVLPDGSLAVLNDNDFGLAGAGVSDNSVLGIIEFGDDNSFDASNDDGTINITNHPVLGMYQPDALACFSVGDRSYFISANEGDARDYEDDDSGLGFSEESRVRGLTLDPTAYPDAATLQEDANLGRLNSTTAYGDYDGDGDIDQIYSYGARSFSIFDAFGNLVYDSGNELELITAELLPTEFNSNNDENGSFDARSDDKGPEPEAVKVVERNGRLYALIGLERVGGVMIYDITDPSNPSFVSYTNNRDFSEDAQLGDESSNPAAGDLGIEDLVYIPAEDSPNGEELVVTANEVSGTISVFGVNSFPNAPITLRILHNNDGESKVLPTDEFGGAARFLSIADSLRSDDTPTVTLSSGDNYLPGPNFNANRARPDGSLLYDAEIINAIGYDALAIGNHEFDFGPDTLALIVAQTAISGATFLSANLDFTAEPNLLAQVQAGNIASRKVVERDGQLIGIVGLTTPSLPTVSSPGEVRVDSNLVGTAQQEIDMLVEDGVNKIILISHLQTINDELELAGQLTDVDVIIAGGGDELLTNDPANEIAGQEIFAEYPIDTTDANGDTVYVVTTPGEYRYIGNLIVEFNEAGEVVTIADESDVVPVLGDMPRDSAVTVIEDSIAAFNATLETNIIATTEVALDGLRASVRTQETNEGNLIADAFVWFYNDRAEEFDLDTTVAVVGIQNGGGIRNDEVIPADTTISELKTFDMLPFSNFVSVLDPISPEQFKAALENSVSRVEDRSGRFAQISGFEIIYDTTGVADSNRIVEVTLDDGTPIVVDYEVVDGAPDITIVTNSFTANGGDDYDEFDPLDFVNIGPSYQRALFEYLIAEDGVNGTITAEEYPEGGEGRIRLLQDIQTMPFSLRIVHNNDGESKVLPTDEFAGADRFVAIVDSLRATGITAVTLSSGDNFLPGPNFNANRARPAGSILYDAEVLNIIDYDALAIGNHEFDFGPDTLQRIIEETAASDATFLSANLDFTNEPGLLALETSGRIADRKTISRDGQEIGVIGLTTESLPTISSPRGVIVDSNLIGIVQQEVDELMADGVNKIILISHLQSINEELMLAGELSDVDIIIAGGGDELLTNDTTNAIGGQEVFDEYPIDTVDADGNTIYVVTTPGEYRYVGNLLVEFDSLGNVTMVADESDVIPVLGDGPVNAQVTEIIDSIVAFNDGLANNLIAFTEPALDGLRASVRTMETNQGNIVADSYVWFYDQVADEFNLDTAAVVVGVQNGGGMRDDEVIPANSDISELKTFDILPFSNFVSVLEPISAVQFKSVLENSVSRVEDRSGRFLQISNFRIVWDSTGVADSSRIFEVTLADGTPIVQNYEVVDGAPDIVVVTNSFTAAGGDDYDEFAAVDFINVGPSYQQVLFDYLTATDGLNGTVTAAQYPEGGAGRIRELQTVSTEAFDLQEFNWQQMPNPFTQDFTVSYELPTREFVRIDLFDVTGQHLRKLTDNTMSAGVHTTNVSAQRLAAGMYFLRVQIGDRVATSRVIKQ